MKIIAPVLVLCSLLGDVLLAQESRRTTATQAKPNIVLILADDFGWGDTSCNNPDTPVKTPAIDRIANEGVRLTNAHTPSACCAPTRYGLLTGRYPWRSYLKERVLSGYCPALIREGRTTIASYLKSQGYRTGGFGKWHLGMDWEPKEGDPENWRAHWKSRDPKVVARVAKGIDHSKPFKHSPVDIGFDYYFGTPSNRGRLPFFIENNRVVGNPRPDARGLLSDPACTRTGVDDLFVKKAISFIEDHEKNHPSKPFFVYLPLNAIHGTVSPPKRFVGKTGMSSREDKILWMNESVGKMLAAMDRLKLTDDTLLIFTSDNGPLNVPKAQRLGHAAAGPYRGFKTTVWDGGTRVPFIARWPGRIPTGTTSDQLVGLTDVLATVADVCGAPLPTGAGPDSVSQLPAILGQKEKIKERPPLVTASNWGFLSLREGKWKAIFGTKWHGGIYAPGLVSYGPQPPKGLLPPDAPKSSKTVRPPEDASVGQLYDLSKDPHETTDLWESHPEIIASLRDKLQRIKQLEPDDSYPAKPEPAKRDQAAKALTQNQPNIVLLISDDDDYEHFGFMGSSIAHTPTLDKLAADGTVFTRAHCPAPLCRPSLASILSGRLPHQHGIYGNYLEKRGIGNDRTKLDPRGSLAHRLKDAGYSTYATGKYWEGNPRQMGFTHGTAEVTMKGFKQFVRQGQDELFNFIDEQHESTPMFIWWAPLLPHMPHDPPPRHMNRFAAAKIPIPSFYKGDREKYADGMRKFYAMGSWFDEGVAQLIEKLKATGEYENTLFLFYVDNGYTFGKPAKNSPTEKGLRTPMFVSWPGGGIPKGKRSDDLNYAIDLHATALDYAGVTVPDDIASQSLRPQIEGQKNKPHDILYGAIFAHAPYVWKGESQVERSADRDLLSLYARTDQWKYILYTQDMNASNERYTRMPKQLWDSFSRNQGEQDLYDLNADPYEEKNLANQEDQKERIADFRKQTLDWWKRTGGGSLEVARATVTPASKLATGQKRVADQGNSAKPNVIVVLTDDQGYGELSCHGHAHLKTPNLDRLAATGFELTDFHVSSKCSPTRAALMTGRHCRHVGVREADNGRNIIGSKFPVAAKLFSDNNYATGIYGKWHLGGHYPFRPMDRGFQESLIHGNGAIGTTGDIWGNDYYDDTYWRNGEKQKVEGYCTDVWFREAMSFMTRSRDKGAPFFCYLSTNAPHGPFIVPEEYAKPYARAGGDSFAKRLGMIGNLDKNMGELMRFLKASNLEENTILIFLSDNGAPRGGDNAGMRGQKGSPYDGGHRVPFLVRWPGGITGGRQDDTLTAHIDVLPTLIDLCGLNIDEQTVFDGTSFASVLRGEETPDALKRTLVESYKGVVMTEQWRLVDGKELYDIQNDPAQKENVASKHEDVVKQLRDVLAENQKLDYLKIPRIKIGSDNQSRQEFTIYHWFDKSGFYRNQIVTEGQLVKGHIPIDVSRSGTYEFTLRRWPAELDVPIRSKPDKTAPGFQNFNNKNSASKYKVLDIRSAHLKVAQIDQSKSVSDEMTSVSFTVDLEPGETKIETWFRTGDGKELGAYFLDVQLVSDTQTQQ